MDWVDLFFTPESPFVHPVAENGSTISVARLGKPVEEIRELNMCTRENAVTPWGQPMEYYNVAWLKITVFCGLGSDRTSTYVYIYIYTHRICNGIEPHLECALPLYPSCCL